MPDRNGKRKSREQLSKRRIPELGYYLIFTDTKETERNYLIGLRDSIPKDLQRKLIIKVCKASTEELVSEAMNMASQHPQYGEPWIVFDRDQVQDFDKIISSAQKNGIHVGWSNPCIEIWFSAYFGSMPTYLDSVSCCSGFAQKFTQITGQEYSKADVEIYQKLRRYGDERRAIEIAERKLKEHIRNCANKPSEMCPCTTVHSLITEITSKIGNE